METFIAALKTRKIKLPKFLLWEIAGHAELALDYSVELAKYFYGRHTFYLALYRGKKLAEVLAKSMSNSQLQNHHRNILASCSEYLVLRISDYLFQLYGYNVFERVALSGNVSLLHALLQKEPHISVCYNENTVEDVLAAGHFQMVEYLLDHDLLHSLSIEQGSSEEVLERIVAKLPKSTVVDYFVKTLNGCPNTASVLKKYL